MATYVWTGAVDTTASTAGNWTPSGPPGAGDIAQMDGGVACAWDITNVGTITTKTPGGFAAELRFVADVALNGFNHDFIIGTGGSAQTLTFSGSPSLASGRYVDISTGSFVDTANRSNLTYIYSAGTNLKFDMGEYPHINITGGTHGPQYSTPTVSANTEVKFLSLTVANGVTFAPTTAAPTANDRTMIFRVESTTFTINAAGFDGGHAKWILQGGSSGSPNFVPVTGDTDHHGGSNTTFTSTIRHLVVDNSTTGVGAHMRLQEGLVLSVESLEISSGACLSGEGNGCTIISKKKPKVDGAWSFKEVSPGIYMHSGKLLLGPPSGGTGLTTLAAGSLLVGDTHDKMTSLGIGSAGQVLKVNSGGTAPEWGAASGSTLTQEQVEDYAGALVATGGTKTGITVTYDDANGDMDFVVTQPHTAHISLSASVTGVTSGAYTIAALNTADIDTASGWDNVNKYYVIPRDGKYLIAWSSAIRYISSSHIGLNRIYLDTGSGFNPIAQGPYAKDSGWVSNGTILLDLDEDDKVALYFYHNGGSGKNLIGDSVTEGATFLSIAEIL